MRHADFIAQYDVPVVDAAAARPSLEFSRRGEGRTRRLVGDVRRRVRGPRLAYLDSHFPWQRSGFRYGDALALREARPDTVFFSMYRLRDSFPAPVLPLAQFPRLAPSLGITDVYGVFLDFMAGVLGLRQDRRGPASPIEGLDLSGVLRRDGIRAHVGLYPGGGWVDADAAVVEAAALVARADTVLSWSPAVLARVSGVRPILPAIIDTAYYTAAAPDFSARPLQLLFVADDKPRKGLAVALAALNELSGDVVHLHVVGPHDPRRWHGEAGRVTLHGWLEREQLRDLHRHCQVFLSPVSAEQPGDPAGDGGITDGFPTTAAGEAMSSGCLLVSANPDGDHRALRPGIDYLEVPATPVAVADAVRSMLEDPDRAGAIARSGSERVRETLDVRRGAAERLALMGLGPDAASPRERLTTRRRVSPLARLGPVAPPPASQELEQQLDALEREIAALRVAQAERDRQLREELAGLRAEVLALGRAALDDASRTRRELAAVRGRGDYEQPFTDADPLVSICIPTYTNITGLLERAVPSALTQDHERIEIVVVGDAAPPETAEAIRSLAEDRIRYENLAIRGPYPEDPRRRWLVAGTGPLNRSMELARGTWIVILNDDDALRPNHVSVLLAAAREARAEVAYGQFAQHAPDGSVEVIGAWPPQSHRFGWQCAVQHRDIARLFSYEQAAALFDEPGDWHRARRMLGAGVRFIMRELVVFDYYPSLLWSSA